MTCARLHDNVARAGLVARIRLYFYTYCTRLLLVPLVVIVTQALQESSAKAVHSRCVIILIFCEKAVFEASRALRLAVMPSLEGWKGPLPLLSLPPQAARTKSERKSVSNGFFS